MQSKNLISVVFIFSVLVGFLGFFAFRIFWVRNQQSKIVFNPQQIHLTLNPPNGSLQAFVTNLSGRVKEEGRTDTDFHDITKPATLIEGESLSTTDNSSTTVTFNNIGVLSLNSNTQLDYLNGLPDALVIRQPSGKILYNISSGIKPFSIRSLGLLTQFTVETKATIVTNTTEQTVYVAVAKGLATLAYSDANNNTQVKQITKGQTAIFDNNASTLTIE